MTVTRLGFFMAALFAGSLGFAQASLAIWKTIAVEQSAPTGISFDPHAEVTVAFTLENVSNAPADLAAFTCRIARTRALAGKPTSIWHSRYENVETLAAWPLKDMVAGASSTILPGQRVHVVAKITPQKYGHFSVMVESSDPATNSDPSINYRAAAFAVVHPPASGPKPESPVMATADEAMRQGDATELELVARYGIKWVRIPLAPEFNSDGSFNWSVADRQAAGLRENALLALTDLGQWKGPSPMIGGRLVSYFWGRKVNLLPAPKDFPIFANQVTELVQRYRDVMPAGYLRNEPWEKGSITFYHGTGQYYGEWLKVASEAARRASPDFPVLSADAITNFEDNIQMRGLTDYVDITSHHAHIKASRGAVQSAVLGKAAWETEDWISHYDAYVIANITMKMAHGYQRTNPCDAGLYLMLPGDVGHPDWQFNSSGPVVLPAPAGQAVSTWLHFVEDTKFIRELSGTHLPWMFLFGDGNDAAAKHAAVVIGRIKAYGYDYHLYEGDIAWPAVTGFGKLLVNDGERSLSVYDFSGNPFERRADGAFEIPLTEDAYYVVSTRGADDVAAKLIAARAHYEDGGFQASLVDFTRPVSTRPPVRVTVQNAVQATVDAVAKLTAPAGWRLVAAEQTLKAMAPGETRELVFEVAEAKESAANRYPFSLEITSAAGASVVKEALHVALFRRGTVNVDGDLSDWEKIGAMPVTVSGGVAAADSVEKYWYPFLNLPGSDSSATQVRFAGAWDDNYFYLCAEVLDRDEQYRPSMEKGTFYTTHDAPLDFLYWGVTPLIPSTLGDGLKIAFDLNRPGKKNDPWLPPAAQLKIDSRFEQLSADYEYDLYLGAQTKLAEPYAAVHDRHLEHLKNPPNDAYKKPWAPFEDPVFTETGPRLPEVWRLMAPGVPRHNYYPFSNRLKRDQGLVSGAKLVVKREGQLWRYEAAIPWSELADVKPAVGREVRFSFYVLNDGKPAAGWAHERSASRGRGQILHPTWQRADAIETVWSFQDFAR